MNNGMMMKKKGMPNGASASDAEDPADQASEPQGEPADEGAADTGSAADQSPANAQGNDQQGGNQASPQDQEAYTRVVLAASKIIYDDASHQQIMQALQGGAQPAEALANVASSIMIEMDKKSGGKIPEDVIVPATMEILDELGMLADKAGLFPVDEQVMAAAAQQTVLKLSQQYGIDQAQMQSMIESMDPAKVKELVAAQQKTASSWAGDGQSAPVQALASNGGPTQQQPGLMGSTQPQTA